MKKLLINLTVLIIMLFSITCCATTKNVMVNERLGASMVVETINGNGQFQIDSIIKADTLPNLNKWLLSSFVDYETNKKVLKRVCIKQYKDGTEVMYIITGQNEPFKIVKRITR